ncbi:MAG TPA: hypothetical protein VKR06_46510 [Ktedonosporobacter sp.]|nr:hypothetical protein [Ktedonosporobacter sp.]
MSQVRGVISHVAANGGNVPLLRLILGVVLVVFFLLALMLQVQTSEAFMLAGSPVGLAPDWGILRQPYDLLHGTLQMDMSKAVMWGWGIELVYLVCVVGEVAVSRWQGWFKTGAIILVGFNFWTDLNYGALPSGFGGQLAFAGITSFIVAFFGVVGLGLIWGAITEMSGH